MSRRIRTAVVDDEPLARQILRDLLAEDPEIELVAEGDGAGLAPTIASLELDLLFLDIEMPEVSGFELLECLGPDAAPPGASPVVVFVTAYESYALRAFEARALDYLLKPFSDARFAAALARAKERLAERRGPGPAALAELLASLRPAPRPPFAERLLVPIGAKSVVVPCAEIDWIEAADYYARLHCGGKTYLLRESMASLEARLDPSRFVRIHRSAIVQLDRIVELHPHFKSDQVVVLRGGRRLALSAARRQLLEERLGRG
jgi:two-component system, LytTR family, response regulator